MDDVAKMATPGLRKIKVFWKEGYDITIFVNDITNNSVSHDSNYIVDVFMWPKFFNLSISMTEFIISQVYKDLTRKTTFFEGWSWFKFNNLGLTLGTNLKFLPVWQKGKNYKSESFLG